MDLSRRKAEFSIAYAHAVASAAGFALEVVRVDVNSVDATLSAVEGDADIGYPSLAVQLKCTNRAHVVGGTIRFPLKIKNYRDLRKTRVLVPRILIVVEVPRSVSEWVEHEESETLIRHCAYWLSLRGWPERPNTGSVTVAVPGRQRFTVAELQAIMGRIGQGGLP